MGFGPPPGFGDEEEGTVKPGPRLMPSEVATITDKPLYDPTALRTLFLDFEDAGWEKEMADFYRTDVEVPATLTVDGKKYPNVGVHFRGMSSFFGVREGSKRSLNVSLDFVDPKQRLYGYKTLNLLNSHEDPTFLHTVLYLQIARNFIPAPKANFVKVVINGESWGLYVNAQQFDKIFLAESFPSDKGARWKVPGNPGAPAASNLSARTSTTTSAASRSNPPTTPRSGERLIKLCKTLNQTPLDQLEEALKPMLDIDGTLWFLALDNALINNDGYWTRSSDYNICRDEHGKFHIIPA